MGLFLITTLKKSVWNLFEISLKCKLEISCEKEEFMKMTDFFEYYLDKLLREPVDLNLVMFWNFIGIKLSNTFGFRIASLIFLFFNSLIGS